MNRTIREAAQVLGVRERDLRNHLRDSKALNRDGSLAAKHIGGGNLFMDPRSRWVEATKSYQHYAVLMVTEAGIAWLAKRLGIEITITKDKDAAA
ncbi:hypothetical protein [Pseudomonas sp. D(2018)]|uniref:hypothetical protein n=1 Tax=Pseudomonas sp. D(2018) TaxID=2502238 RepID=UPI0010F97C3C|nr:hypothetical protein [Pseudomonas sp. D(2018)]